MIFKCILMSKWQFNSTLTSFSLLADYSSIKLIKDAFLNLSRTPQTVAQFVEFLPNTNAFINKFWGLCHVKTESANAIVYRFHLEKWHWGRYQIIQIKLYQYKRYQMGGTNKHEISKYKTGKDGTSKYIHQTILERVASITM